jgi:hypothetical protein
MSVALVRIWRTVAILQEERNGIHFKAARWLWSRWLPL